MSIRMGVLLCAFTAAASLAQTPAFEVVSVKRNLEQGPRSMRVESAAGRFSMTGLPLLALLVYAYDVPINPSERLRGVPDWAIQEAYDVEAKAPAGAFPASLSPDETRARMQAMVKSLLADRFKLSVRAESKDMTRYALMVAPGGLKLPNATIDPKKCGEATPGTPGCHQIAGGMGRGMHGKAIDMRDIAHTIENWTDHPVVDTTGIDGLYAIETEGWAPMRLPPPPPDSIPPARPSGDGDMRDPGRPTIFVVLRRLGLELKQEKGPVEVYVVEHVERPTAN